MLFLIAEAEPQVREVLEALIRGRTHEVDIVEDPTQITAQLQAGRHYDAILSCDHALISDGLMALECSRTLNFTGHFIVMTWPEREDKVRELHGHYVPRNSFQALIAAIESFECRELPSP